MLNVLTVNILFLLTLRVKSEAIMFSNHARNQMQTCYFQKVLKVISDLGAYQFFRSNGFKRA